MDLLRFAHKRLDVFLSEIDRLLRSEFPYEDSRRAILRIQEEVKIRRSKVLEELKKREFKGQESAGTEAAEARLRRLESRAASESLAVLFESLPRLGFLLRSTNVRNAFEIYGPLCRLANQLLSPHLASRESRVQMVLSSEFNYSPFLDPYPLLDDFVLIGFPAPESSNPLLIPLAGHELGHAVWRKAGFENRFLSRVQQIVVKRIIDKKVDYVQLLADMKADGLDFAKLKDAPEDFFKYMEPAINWAMSQAEECFADFVGLRLFGSSFLYAFAYLLAPHFLEWRSETYPNVGNRVKYLDKASQKYSIKVPPNFTSVFKDLKEPVYIFKLFGIQLEIADFCVQQIVDDLIGEARKAVEEAGLGDLHSDRESDIATRLKLKAPIEGSPSIVPILNVAWEAYNKLPKFWPPKDDEERDDDKLDDILKDIVLKSIEIFEIEQILG